MIVTGQVELKLVMVRMRQILVEMIKNEIPVFTDSTLLKLTLVNVPLFIL